jgi:hypothetical protein
LFRFWSSLYGTMKCSVHFNNIPNKKWYQSFEGCEINRNLSDRYKLFIVKVYLEGSHCTSFRISSIYFLISSIVRLYILRDIQILRMIFLFLHWIKKTQTFYNFQIHHYNFEFDKKDTGDGYSKVSFYLISTKTSLFGYGNYMSMTEYVQGVILGNHFVTTLIPYATACVCFNPQVITVRK